MVSLAGGFRWGFRVSDDITIYMFVFHPKSDDLAPKPLTAIKLVTLTIENPLYYVVENQPPPDGSTPIITIFRE